MEQIEPAGNCRGCYRLDCDLLSLPERARKFCGHYSSRVTTNESKQLKDGISRTLDRINPEHRDHQIPMSKYMDFLLDLDKTTLEQEMQYWLDREVYERCEYIRIALNLKFPKINNEL